MHLLKVVFLYLSLGWVMAPVIGWVEKYVFSDWEYLKFLFVVMMVDTALGVYKAIVKKRISSKGFGMVLRKIIIYTCALITTSALVKFTIEGAPQAAFSFFNNVVFSAIMLRETISIFENIAEIDPNVLPKYLLKYLHRFDSLTGKKLNNES